METEGEELNVIVELIPQPKNDTLTQHLGHKLASELSQPLDRCEYHHEHRHSDKNILIAAYNTRIDDFAQKRRDQEISTGT